MVGQVRLGIGGWVVVASGGVKEVIRLGVADR